MLETKRLILRKWQLQDLSDFANLNACEKVCEFLPKILTKQESDELANKIIKHFDDHGFGLFALQRKDNDKFIGFTGLSIPSFNAHFMPAVEIGWRLAFKQWGNGFACEAAKAVIEYAKEDLKLKELVSFTAVKNYRSIKVMEKIGMTHNKKDDFNHPKLDISHPLSRHVLYRLKL